jgi:hypothetical protein
MSVNYYFKYHIYFYIRLQFPSSFWTQWSLTLNMGYCNPYLFPNKRPWGVIIDVNEIYTWRVDFASDFDGIFFLWIPFRKMHSFIMYTLPFFTFKGPKRIFEIFNFFFNISSNNLMKYKKVKIWNFINNYAVVIFSHRFLTIVFLYFQSADGAPCPPQTPVNCITPMLFFLSICGQFILLIAYMVYRWVITVVMETICKVKNTY